MIGMIENRVGPFKLKDSEQRHAKKISNKAGKYFAIKEIIVRKIPGKNNTFELILRMPKPEDIDIVEKKPAIISGKQTDLKGLKDNGPTAKL